VAEVAIPGVRAHRSLVLPRLPRGSRNPDAVVLRASRDARTGCVTVGPDVRCVAGRERPSEEAHEMRRIVRLPGDASYLPSLTVVPRVGAALGSLLERGQPLSATASSSAVADTRASAFAAVDGDPGTTWVADGSDLRPTLSLSWLGQRAVSGVALSVDQDTAARRPDRVVLIWPGGRTEVDLDDRGRARFPAIRTDRLSLRVDSAELASSLGFDRSVTPVPIGISEVRVTGVPFFPARLPTTPVVYPCGTGPRVTVNGRSFRTSVTARPTGLFAMKPALAEICDVGNITLRAGENTVALRGSSAFDVDSLVLRGDGLPGAATRTRASGLASATPVRRVVRVGERAQVLGLRENFNPGWSATRDGRALPALVLDGWQQGFEVRGDEGAVAVTFGPDRAYRWGLGVGVLCLALLGAVVLLPQGRSSGRALPEATRREFGPGLSLALGVLGAGLLAGWIGVLVAVAGGGLAVVIRGRWPEAVWWVLAGVMPVASLAYLVRPWGSAAGWAGALAWPHYLVLVPLAGALALSSARSVAPPRRLRRIAGRSTSR
jgi:arabinofuranan 3-O-arabinosyltransferase